MRQRLRPYMQTLAGGALLVLAMDGCIAVFRLIGLPRDSAIYAGLVTFALIATFVARRWFSLRGSSGEKPHG